MSKPPCRRLRFRRHLRTPTPTLLRYTSSLRPPSSLRRPPHRHPSPPARSCPRCRPGQHRQILFQRQLEGHPCRLLRQQHQRPLCHLWLRPSHPFLRRRCQHRQFHHFRRHHRVQPRRRPSRQPRRFRPPGRTSRPGRAASCLWNYRPRPPFPEWRGRQQHTAGSIDRFWPYRLSAKFRKNGSPW